MYQSCQPTRILQQSYPIRKTTRKAIGGKIKFILLETIGHAYIDMDVSEEDMLLALKELQERYQDEY